MDEFAGFSDRLDAGRQLADLVSQLDLASPVVIGLPRGGVPVAAQVAARLNCPLDVIVVRKLGVPSQPELGLGAISESGVRVFNDDVLALARISAEELDELISREQSALEQRLAQIRAVHPAVGLRDKSVVIVDDGIATGIDARAACRVARARGARQVVLAVPVAPADWRRRLSNEADQLVAVAEPRDFMAVGQFYVDFLPVEDAEMLRYLDVSR